MDRLAQIHKMLDTNPDDIFLHYALAMEFNSLNRLDEAIEKLRTLRTNYPEYLPLYYQLGQLLEKQNKQGEAIEAYEQGMLVATNQKDMKTYGELRSALEELTF